MYKEFIVHRLEYLKLVAIIKDERYKVPYGELDSLNSPYPYRLSELLVGCLNYIYDGVDEVTMNDIIVGDYVSNEEKQENADTFSALTKALNFSYSNGASNICLAFKFPKQSFSTRVDTAFRTNILANIEDAILYGDGYQLLEFSSSKNVYFFIVPEVGCYTSTQLFYDFRDFVKAYLM